MTLGKRIREGRKQAQRTLEEVSDATGIHINYLVKIEGNKARNPGINIVLKLCRELSMSPNEITGWDDDEDERRRLSGAVGSASEDVGEPEWLTERRG